MEAAEKTLYRMAPRTSDRWLIATAVVGAIASLHMASRNPWLGGLYALAVAGIVVNRIWRGPAPPVLCSHDSALEIRENYPPHALHSVPLRDLKRVVVAGPMNDRRFFFYFHGQSVMEVRPFFPSSLSKKAEIFLREILPPGVELESKPQPTFMEQVRGDYP